MQISSYLYSSESNANGSGCFEGLGPERECPSGILSSTFGAVPRNPNMLKSSAIPFGVIFCPFFEVDEGSVIHVDDTDSVPILRCENRDCRAFVNPYCLFMNGLEKWRCSFCGAINRNYHLSVDMMGDGGARDMTGSEVCGSRPELRFGCVDYLATSDFLKRPPASPTFVFLIDVSLNAVCTGILHIITNTLRQIFPIMPVSERTRVCIMTFDSNLHFYDVTSSSPEMLVCGNVNRVFIPPGFEFLLNRKEYLKNFEELLDRIPSFFKDSLDGNVCLGTALQTAQSILLECGGGKVVLFLTTIPEKKADGDGENLGPGRISIRVTLQNYRTLDEGVYLKCTNSWYKTFGQKCALHKIVVDLFAFGRRGGGHLDLAILSQITTFSHGQLYYYPEWNPVLHGERFCRELEYHLMKPTFWDVHQKVKTTPGLAVWGVSGFYSSIGCDRALTFSLKLTEMINCPKVCMQISLIYTTSGGDRRIRVVTVAFPVVCDISEVYSYADPYAIVAFIGKMNIMEPLEELLKNTRKKINDLSVNILSKKNFSSNVIFPEKFEVVPVMALGLIKSDILVERNVWPDIKVAAILKAHHLSKDQLLQFIYPSLYRVYSLNSIDADGVDIEGIWQTRNLTSLTLTDHEIFLLDNGEVLILHFGSSIPLGVIEELFGIQDKIKIINENLSLRSSRVVGKGLKIVVDMVETIRYSKQRFQPILVSFEGLDYPNTRLFMNYMIEDSRNGLPSYQQYIANLLEIARRLNSKY